MKNPLPFTSEFVDSFWLRVNKAGPVPLKRPELGPCWLWTAGKTRGYGHCWLAPCHNLRAHRAAYELEIGPIPEGLEIDHLCRNLACVRPTHLEPVTHLENVRRGLKGQVVKKTPFCRRGHDLTGVAPSSFGYRPCPICKLNAAKALEQRRVERQAKRAARALAPRKVAHKPGEFNGQSKLTDEQVLEIRRRAPSELYKTLAAEFGVRTTNICKIVLRQNWKHI